MSRAGRQQLVHITHCSRCCPRRGSSLRNRWQGRVMTQVKNWHVDIYIGERDGKTRAEARLRPAEDVTLTGEGWARLNPIDEDVPEIGDELAVSRALSDLAHRLLHAAVDDIEGMTQEKIRPYR